MLEKAMQKKDIMEFEKTLPDNFNGTFMFTNWTDEEFVGVWAKKEYHFPPNATSPIVILDQTPLEVQWIRKKFARDLAEREYTKSKEWSNSFAREQDQQGMKRLTSLHQAGTYSVNELTPFIQKCLDPLPAGHADVKKIEFVPIEEKLSRDNQGDLNTISMDDKSQDPINELKKANESLRRKTRI